MSVSFEDLSPELLVKIFSYYIESEEHMAFSKNVVPVCRMWWEVSSTPSLWKSVHLQNRNYALCISKTGLLSHTTSLKISRYDPDGNAFSFDGHDLLAVFSSICNLKCLEMPAVETEEHLMASVAEHCRNLEHLHVRGVTSCENARQMLDAFLIACGSKLKHLNLDFCVIARSKSFIIAMAAQCTSLEVFEWHSLYTCPEFPIYEFMSGCRRLRKLEIHYCHIVVNIRSKCSGFEDLRVFKAWGCKFGGLDLYSVLKNSRNLERLELKWNDNLVLDKMSEIPSKNIGILEVRFRGRCLNSENAVEQAVAKWKRTLSHLQITCITINSMLRMFLDDNLSPKLEALRIEGSSVEPSLLKTFIEECENLNELEIQIKGVFESMQVFRNREQIIELWNSLGIEDVYYEMPRQFTVQWISTPRKYLNLSGQATQKSIPLPRKL